MSDIHEEIAALAYKAFHAMSVEEEREYTDEIIAKVRDHYAMQRLNAAGYTKHIQSKTIERVLAAVEKLFHVPGWNADDVIKAIKGVGDE